MNLTQFFEEAVHRSASDIHLATGETPRFRIGGKLVAFGEPLDLHGLLDEFLTPEASARLSVGLNYESTLLHGDKAFVGIVFRIGNEGLGATFRILPTAIPDLDVIAEDATNLFGTIAEAPRGLVLVTGLTGSGKWTTVSSVIDRINATRAARIFVVSAHPSLWFTSRQSLLTQLHVGQDCESYGRALDLAMQADVDVVALDDIPTYETLRQALVLADTGHLIIANLHAPTVAEALERLFESAGDEAPALRHALAQNLVAATGQRLLPGIERGRAPAYEWIVNSPGIREALLQGDLRTAQAADPACRTVEAALATLVAAGRITEEAAAG